MVKKIWSKSKYKKGLPGWKFDTKTARYYSYGFQKRLPNGKRVQKSGFPTKELAEAALSKLHIQNLAERYELPIEKESPTLKELFRKKENLSWSERERKYIKLISKRFLAILPRNYKVREVTSADISRYIEKRQNEGVTNETINTEVTRISAALHKASELFPELKDYKSPRIPRPSIKRQGRQRLLTYDEITKLGNYLLEPQKQGENTISYRARIKVGQMFKFALMTGARRGEVENLKWSQIDFKRKTLLLIKKKTERKVNNSVVHLKLTKSMEEILIARKETSDSEFVFSKSGKASRHFYNVFKKACEACGITYGRDREDGVIFHDVRHWTITYLLQNGIDMKTIGAVVGLSDDTLILYYSIASEMSKVKAQDSIHEVIETLISH